jgi:hypothetical protein
MKIGPADFSEVWLVDFEFRALPGERPDPICLVAIEMGTGRVVRLWQEELRGLKRAPYGTAPETLFVAYYASAELGCHLALDWPLPSHILDLFVEFRTLTNGTPTASDQSLLGALVHFGLDGMTAVEKEQMRALALRGGPWSPEETTALLDYCESDVVALTRLLPLMLPHIDVPRAILRGRSMKAITRMEHLGVPIDTGMLATLRERWSEIQDALIDRIDADYGVFDGRTFKADRWAQYLIRNEIAWPRLESGNLALDDDTFREMARAYPRVAPIRELRFSLSQMRLADLTVGRDGRNRCLLSPFRARTSRNQPGNSKFIFGPAVWLRGLIRPEPGFSLAYIDWEQQEFGIAAALSGDPAMIAAYESGDPYLAFAKLAGAVPPNATKQTHPAVREQFKACALAVQYGMGADSLALKIGQSPFTARELLRKHREAFPRFWRWSEGVVNHAMLKGNLHTVFGWRIRVGSDVNPRMLRNFPMQANGAEMLRLACSLATERGIWVCAPVHDAVLIEAPVAEIDTAVTTMQGAMAEASRIVLDGFELRSEAKLIHYPDRYMDQRGVLMWETVQDVLAELEADRPVRSCTGTRCASATLPVHPCTPVLSYISSSSTSCSSE